jgi:hypothetical protein
LPLSQNVEKGQGIGQTTLKIRPDTMSDFLEMTHSGEHREGRFDQHPSVPLATLAQFQVSGMPNLLSETFIAEDEHQVSHAVNQVLKSRAIIHISRVARLLDHQAEMIDQHT